jgi:mono/diheme cytochrome c family protein
VAYARRASRQPYPGFAEQVETVGPIFARYCVGCHKIEGDGGTEGPDLTHAGEKHDAATLRRWIVDPEQVDPDAEMPSFGDRLSAAQLDAIAAYLAARK